MNLGFFDSGVGGLTILEEVHKLMPVYDTVYLGDAARAPYGERTHDELVQFLKDGAQWLFDQDCDLVIVACNSASASALREVQQTWLPSFPGKRILGIIRPTVEALAAKNYQHILILSTEATARSAAYVHEFSKLDPHIRVSSHACPRWAPMIEEGKAGTLEMKFEVEREMLRAEAEFGRADAVLLACTHYPYVKTDVERCLDADVPVFNQGLIVAHSLKDYLARHPEFSANLSLGGNDVYFTTGSTEVASLIATERFGYDVEFRPALL